MKRLERKPGIFAHRSQKCCGIGILLGVLISCVPAFAQNLQDFFTNRVVFTSSNSSRSGNNSASTVEPNEPKHGGKTGGHSLWMSWIAPADGVVTFDTSSSTFDTLLSAYYFQNTNDTALGQLKEIARNDDEPRFPTPGALRTSLISFGVQAGKHYEIAVDGYRGATGAVELRWSFQTAPSTPPIVLSTPNSQAVQLGDPVTLSIDITPAPNVNLQWRFNGESFGQTGNTLFIPNLQAADLGTYTLRVEIEVGADRVRFETTPFELQINSEGQTNAFAQDKLLDSSGTPLVGSDGSGSALTVGGFKMLSIVSGGGGVQNLGVVRGYNGSQIFNTFLATKDPSEPAHCDVVGGSSYWLIYQPPTNGTLTLNTLGSTYDTVMETYTYNGALTGYQDLISIACDNNGFGTNGPSRIQIPVVKSRQYIISVDGVNAAYGTAWLNYSLNTNQPAQPPSLTSVPQPVLAAQGSTVTLTAPVTGAPPLAFTWRKDGVVIPGASSSVFVIPNATTNSSGTYTFAVTNDLGGLAQSPIVVAVIQHPTCTLTPVVGSPNALKLSFSTVVGRNYFVEDTTNLFSPWTSWPTFFIGDGNPINAYVWKNGNRFFRVRVE